MKKGLLFIWLALSACSATSKPSIEQVQNIPIRALALGSLTDLTLSKNEKNYGQHWIKVLSSPSKKQDCLAETHIHCNYTYYISISDLDDAPEYSIYKIANIGEIIDFRWLETSSSSAAHFSIIIKQYTEGQINQIKKELYISKDSLFVK